MNSKKFFIILVITFAGTVLSQDQCDKTAGCKTCKTEDKKYCLSCLPEGKNSKYAWKGECKYCYTLCAENKCTDEKGCTGCNEGYKLIDTTNVKDYPGKICTLDTGGGGTATGFGVLFIILVFILSPLLCLICLVVLICCLCNKTPDAVQLDVQSGNYHPPHAK